MASAASLLLNLTNDAWYGLHPAPTSICARRSFVPWKHVLPLVRAANNGISVVTDPAGASLEACRSAKSVCSTSLNFRRQTSVLAHEKGEINFGLIIVIMVLLALVARRSKS
jgi:apolipoprotein N-acyltransferase